MTIETILTKTNFHTHLTNSTFGSTWKHKMFDRDLAGRNRRPLPCNPRAPTHRLPFFFHRASTYLPAVPTPSITRCSPLFPSPPRRCSSLLPRFPSPVPFPSTAPLLSLSPVPLPSPAWVPSSLPFPAAAPLPGRSSPAGAAAAARRPATGGEWTRASRGDGVGRGRRRPQAALGDRRAAGAAHPERRPPTPRSSSSPTPPPGPAGGSYICVTLASSCGALHPSATPSRRPRLLRRRPASIRAALSSSCAAPSRRHPR